MLPRITANEAIESDLVQHGLYRKRVQASATIRVYPAEAGQPVNEVRTSRTRNGKPAANREGVVSFESMLAFGGIASAYLSPGYHLLRLYGGPLVRTLEPRGDRSPA